MCNCAFEIDENGAEASLDKDLASNHTHTDRLRVKNNNNNIENRFVKKSNGNKNHWSGDYKPNVRIRYAWNTFPAQSLCYWPAENYELLSHVWSVVCFTCMKVVNNVVITWQSASHHSSSEDKSLLNVFFILARGKARKGRRHWLMS